MMNKNTKGLIVVGVLGIVAYILYKKFKTKKLSRAESIVGDNFAFLQEKLGVVANKDGIVIIQYNDGKNQAQYYSNNRVIIFDAKTKPVKLLKKGTYSEGGISIKLDGGREVRNTSSAWQTISEATK